MMDYLKENKMKALHGIIGILIFLFVVQAKSPVHAQEHFFQMHLVTDLPPELNPDHRRSCSLELHEEWIIDPSGASVSKSVKSFELPCENGTSALSQKDDVIRLRNLSYEFSFLDLPEQMAKEVQNAFIALINNRFAIPGVYDPAQQLLSIHFHEDWTLEPGNKVFKKKVRAITPVIWQRRQTADGEPVLDPDTGFPVFYKQSLERIDLRQP